MNIGEIIRTLWNTSGFNQIFTHWENAVMIVIACVLLYLAIVRGFEPLLLMGIAFGMLLANLPMSGMMHMEFFSGKSLSEISFSQILHEGGILDVLYLGVKLNLYPCLIFMGIGAMTDFGPMLARPSSMILGAAAQLGVYCAFILAIVFGFGGHEAASIGIIGGADGPTAIFLTSFLAPHLLGPIAVAAYSYMALIPLIQPPIMKALTTKKERETVMTQAKPVNKTTKIIFPIAVTVFCVLLLPDVAPLIGCFMLGNLFRESGVVDRLSDTAQNNLLNIVTIFLSVTVGATSVGYIAGTDKATGEVINVGFLSTSTILIILLGLLAFSFSTAGGVIFGKLMYAVTGGKVNPLIGSAGVSAVPMAARVSQNVGAKYNPSNYLLMHAMGPNVAGVIGSAVAAGFLLSVGRVLGWI
ncbi:MAG: sodium ion-translocating decarboxylase subunit beta [Oscillospiraceae bacterium]|jgi:oxaloacetate decarboxylase beta subunit|nr:sodium ion-translocating decarboxylase subunit beta [Oscillospiraceae bacterium]